MRDFSKKIVFLIARLLGRLQQWFPIFKNCLPVYQNYEDIPVWLVLWVLASEVLGSSLAQLLIYLEVLLFLWGSEETELDLVSASVAECMCVCVPHKDSRRFGIDARQLQ